MLPPPSLPISYASDFLAAQPRHHFWEAPHLAHLLAGFRREFLAEAAACTVGWRLPAYERYFASGDFLENVTNDGRGDPMTLAQKIVAAPIAALLPAAFIEWRYYAILTPEFHGILGVSLFNPKNQVESLTEGGLICILSGTLDGHAEHFCWQHVFPLSHVHFSGDKCEDAVAEHEGIRLEVRQHALNAAHVALGPVKGGAQSERKDVPTFSFHHTGLEDTALFPCLVEDLKRVPGAHWIVHNPSPVARVEGTLSLPAAMFRGWRTLAEGGMPNYASEGLLARAQALSESGRETHPAFCAPVSGSGYYEHSFGVNPMPLHGWDFLFAPDAENGTGLVMQTYLRSDAMRFIEVLWTEDGARKYTRFGKDDFSLEWSETVFHPQIRACVPLQRTITGKREGYTLSITNDIPEQLPFLRKKKFVVRHYFITEQMGTTHWVLKDKSGREVARSRPGGVLSGGEVAYPRVFTPGL